MTSATTMGMPKMTDAQASLVQMVKDIPTSGDFWSIRRYVGTHGGRASLRFEFDSQLPSRSEELSELQRLVDELVRRGLQARFHRWTITAALPAPAVDPWADFDPNA